MGSDEPSSYIAPQTQIGERVTIGSRVLVGSTGGAPVTIHDDVTIGMGVIVDAGITVGTGATIRAGAVVVQDVPPNAIVQGNPAVIVGYGHVQHDGRGATVIRTPGPIGVKNAKFFELKSVSDLRGGLSVGEVGAGLPFTPKRAFFVYDVPSDRVRGEHAHRECEQLLIAAHGTIHAVVDDGVNRAECVLDSPRVALHMGAGIWGTQYRYSEDAVLMVLASHLYDNDDYIRTYEEFRQFISQRD